MKEHDKHFKVSQWFEQNKDQGVWHKVSGKWVISINPKWEVNDEFAINDDYAIYRKAIKDNKTIQFLKMFIGTHPIDPTWMDWNSYGECFSSDMIFRIKEIEEKI